MMITITMKVALPDDLRDDELSLLQTMAPNAVQSNVYLRAGEVGRVRLVAPRVVNTKINDTHAMLLDRLGNPR